ncbi:SDR family oxidoreductase [SAR202 cluster bacterium AD-804-J14_MRT_500m]|nr:SDR family oxidoreductase [SAR202 cluster bacterium AD-804-J14_MRT_500m]
MRLEGKVALITGAASGIGKATAELFAREGAKISVTDVNETSVKAVADAIVAAGGDAVYSVGDVSLSDDAKRIVETTINAFGKVNVLLNNAGINDRIVPSEYSDEEVWDRVMEVNVKGVYLMAWYCVPDMINCGGGSIINMASVMGLVGSEYTGKGGFSAYVPSKGAVVQFTKNLALAHAKSNLRVNCICPGYVETNLVQPLIDNPDLFTKIRDRHPMGRFGRPEEIANAALFLASDESSFVTGSPLIVDGGFTAQ